MSGRNDQDQIFDLMEEIERAWMERGDHSVVDRLAAQHPALAEKLYLFFATVVDAPDELDRSRPELAEQSKRISDWLREGGGFAAATAAGETDNSQTASPFTGGRTPLSSSPPPPTFFGLLKHVSDSHDPEAMASRLDVSVDFLREVSKHTDRPVLQPDSGLPLPLGSFATAKLSPPAQLLKAGGFASAEARARSF